jgi:hypothetical protein
MSAARPNARKDGMLVRDLGDEVVVYELESHRGHCLNRTAALVWHACDGRSTVAAIAAQLGSDLGVPADEGLVRYALRRLRDARLLDSPIEGTTLTRRQVARRFGQAALLPVVISLLAPKPSEAATCEAGCPTCDCSTAGDGTTCWNGVDCSSYVCCNGSCVPPGPCP